MICFFFYKYKNLYICQSQYNIINGSYKLQIAYSSTTGTKYVITIFEKKNNKTKQNLIDLEVCYFKCMHNTIKEILKLH